MKLKSKFNTVTFIIFTFICCQIIVACSSYHLPPEIGTNIRFLPADQTTTLKLFEECEPVGRVVSFPYSDSFGIEKTALKLKADTGQVLYHSQSDEIRHIRFWKCK